MKEKYNSSCEKTAFRDEIFQKARRVYKERGEYKVYIHKFEEAIYKEYN